MAIAVTTSTNGSTSIVIAKGTYQEVTDYVASLFTERVYKSEIEVLGFSYIDATTAMVFLKFLTTPKAP